jgi:hypothetical protein
MGRLCWSGRHGAPATSADPSWRTAATSAWLAAAWSSPQRGGSAPCDEPVLARGGAGQARLASPSGRGKACGAGSGCWPTRQLGSDLAVSGGLGFTGRTGLRGLWRTGFVGCRMTPANKGMKLTRPVTIGALQLIPGVRWTRWSGSAPDRAIAILEAGPAAASFAKSVGGQSNWLCRHGGRVPLWRGGSRPLGVNGPRART